jgi:glutathione synthase/RimK-type ligase-like ATP-grasp enzyme
MEALPMSPNSGLPIAILYEHPDWFRPLFAELDRRGTPYVALDAAEHAFDPSESRVPYGLVFNRMSPSAYLRGGRHTIFYTSQYLDYLEHRGVRVLNGWMAWQTEISKAAQLTLLEGLGLPFPPARVIHHPAQAPAAAEALRFPIVVKPNIGGSGAGVRRFDAPQELAAAVPDLDLGVDHTALVQEFIPAESGRIVRVEVLDGRFLYAIRVYTDGAGFNLCPADVCQGVDGTELERTACPADAPKNGLRVEGYSPPREIVDQVERITAAAGIEIGGVEYVIDERDGRLYYYDVNALSNFVADAPRVVGFDPCARLADWLERETAAVAAREEAA